MSQIAVLEGYRRRRRHKKRVCRFGVNKRTHRCLKKKRTRRKHR